MLFRSEAELPQTDWRISHSTPLLLAGSCFSDRVGELLDADKFDTLYNPFGVIYHPIPLLKLLADSALHVAPSRLVGLGEHWGCWDATTEFYEASKEELMRELAEIQESARLFLQSADYLVLTFGTAWGYVLKEDGLVVANCHKAPQAAFERRLFSPEEMLKAVLPMLQCLRGLRPELRIILTVSPVRHLREGVSNDRLSKSALRWLCHRLTQEVRDVLYFPSYELVVDELRDYRFTQPDLMHPTAQATEYVYQRFGEAFFSDDTQALLAQWRAISKELKHEPRFPGSKEHKRFIAQLKAKLKDIARWLDVSNELDELEAQESWE